jgi:hypothetical protein
MITSTITDVVKGSVMEKRNELRKVRVANTANIPSMIDALSNTLFLADFVNCDDNSLYSLLVIT